MTRPQSTQPEFFSAQISKARRFYLDVRPARSETLSVLCGGCEHCSADYEIHRRSFPYWSIEFVAQGKGTLTLGRKNYPLVAGTVFAYGPRIGQDIVSDPQQPLVKYFVDFTGKSAQKLLRRYGPAPGTIQQTSAPSEILSVFDDLIRNGQRSTPLSARITAIVLEHLIVKLAETAIPLGTAGTPAFATYLRCRQMIEEHWTKIKTMEQIAAGCHIDPAYLCRIFRRFDYQSPYQYLLRFKMNHAAQLLAEPDVAVKKVAQEMGFSDAFHFSRVFKKVMGIAPGQFAKQHQRT